MEHLYSLSCPEADCDHKQIAIVPALIDRPVMAMHLETVHDWEVRRAVGFIIETPATVETR